MKKLLVIVLLFFSTPAIGAEITLAWDGVTCEGYRLFSRIAGEQYDYANPIWENNSGKTTTATIPIDVNIDLRYYVVRAYVGDQESADSNEVAYPAIVGPPENAKAKSILFDNGEQFILDEP